MELNDLKQYDIELDTPHEYLLAYLKQHLVNRGKSKGDLIQGFINSITDSQEKISGILSKLPYKSYGIFAKHPDKNDPDQIVYFFLLPMDIEWENHDLVLPLIDTIYVLTVYLSMLVSPAGEVCIYEYLQFLEETPIAESVSPYLIPKDFNWRLGQYELIFGQDIYTGFMDQLEGALLIECDSLYSLKWYEYLFANGPISLERLAHRMTYPTYTDKEMFQQIYGIPWAKPAPILEFCMMLAHLISVRYLAISASDSHLYLVSLEYAQDKLGVDIGGDIVNLQDNIKPY